MGVYIYSFKIFLRKSDLKFSSNQIAFFDLTHNRFERYLYLLCKFYLMNGYIVVFKVNFTFLGNLERYSSMLLMEKDVYFSFKEKRTKFYFHTDISRKDGIYLSDEYFCKPNNYDYHIPMTQHPLMYHHGYWNIEITPNKRFNSIFFAGSLEKGQYDRPEINSIFEIFNRQQLASLLVESQYWLDIENIQELNSEISQKIVFLNRKKVDVPMADLRLTLSKFNFFMACPGVSMPFSHNIIEAMSVGTIPIIEQNYALLFEPKLIHLENTIIFSNSKNSLFESIQQALLLKEEQIETIRQNVINYYNKYYLPIRVIEKLHLSEVNKCYLNAESFSVNYLRK